MKKSNQEMSPLHELPSHDAIGMLVADHKRVANLFADFKRLTQEGEDKEKASVVRQICQELTVHTQVEEELFYPAVRDAIDDADQMDEALVEHAGAKQLIAQLQAADPDDALYDAKVTVLGEQIDHHVDEEEGSMFPKARYSGLDMLKLGATMLARKAKLRSGAPAGLGASPALHTEGRAEEFEAEDEADAQFDEKDELSGKSSKRHAKKKSAKPKATAKTKTRR